MTYSCVRLGASPFPSVALPLCDGRVRFNPLEDEIEEERAPGAAFEAARPPNRAFLC